MDVANEDAPIKSVVDTLLGADERGYDLPLPGAMHVSELAPASGGTRAT